jgi:hypothetical protein
MLLYADIDLADIDDARSRHDYLRDRRPALYDR